jgi:hypothetical protein
MLLNPTGFWKPVGLNTKIADGKKVDTKKMILTK